MTPEEQNAVTVGFVALGCPKNTVDSERMLAEIAQAGYVIAAEPESAEVIVINTCGFIERLGLELLDLAKGVDAVIGLGQRDNVARIINKTLCSDTTAAYLNCSCEAVTDEATRGRPERTKVHDDRVRLRITPAHWAYLRISEGCSHRCSFCTIPAIRGPFRSKPPEMVLAEADELVSAGAVELNIIGQDTTYYGRDLKKKNSLSALLSELEKIPGLRWLRLMYTYPAEIDDRLIQVVGASGRVVHYIDMPIQHVSTEILKRMRRPDTKERICSLIDKLRSVIPDIVLRTTLIAGFPGESDEQFGELLEFVKWAQFDNLGCFKYYPESGTPAALMPGQLPEQLKEERVEELMLTQQEIAFAKNRTRVGSTLNCLVDSTDGVGHGRGRFYGQAPDIDSVCIVENCSATPAQFVDTKVIGTKDYDLIVEQI
jgi:ribosomal protein S12 methylthiotransferase